MDFLLIQISFNFVFCFFFLAFGITCYDCDSSTGAQCNFGLLSFTYPTQDCDKVESGSGFLDAVTKIFPKNCVKLVGISKNRLKLTFSNELIC